MNKMGGPASTPSESWSWASTHPEHFIQGNDEDLRNDPASFIAIGGRVLACGRDPFFPAWPDVLQLNAFNPGLRSAIAETVQQIAAQCDGVRCDMAMTVLSLVATLLAALAHWFTLRRLRRGESPALRQWPSSITLAMLFLVIGLAGLWALLVP